MAFCGSAGFHKNSPIKIPEIKLPGGGEKEFGDMTVIFFAVKGGVAQTPFPRADDVCTEWRSSMASVYLTSEPS